MQTSDAEIQFERLPCGDGRHALGVIRLNRPGQINALSLAMCEAMLLQCRRWVSDQEIVAVVILGNGAKGFCGGGDVARVVREIRAGGAQRFEYGDLFFSTEYHLNKLLHQFPKPLITWAHGITFGGGLALSNTGSVRILSPNMRIAMPEVQIGMFPDVGGGWFLNRVPGRLGYLIGLTGIVFNEHDALFTGLGDVVIPYEDQAGFIAGLCEIEWGESTADHRAQTIHTARQWASKSAIATNFNGSALYQHYFTLRDICGRAKLNGIAKGMVEASAADSSVAELLAGPIASLERGSPTAAAVTFDYLNRSRMLSLPEVLAGDVRLAHQFTRRPDFIEGVRALLIDKDKAPKWSLAREQITSELVAQHFD